MLFLSFDGAKVEIIFELCKKKWKKISFNPIFFHFFYKIYLFFRSEHNISHLSATVRTIDIIA